MKGGLSGFHLRVSLEGTHSLMLLCDTPIHLCSCAQGLKIPKVHCVAHPTYSRQNPLSLFAKSSQFWRAWVGHRQLAQLQYYGFYCSLERTTFFVLKDKTKLLHVHDSLQRQPGITPDSKSACCAIFISELVPGLMVKPYGQTISVRFKIFTLSYDSQWNHIMIWLYKS